MISEKLGLFGGSFNPVHNGHIKIAKMVLKSFNLTKILFILSPRPPHKEITDILPAETRMKMLYLAIRDIKEFDISSIELERNGLSFTVDTLEILKNKLGKDKKFYFILGSDNYLELETWKNKQRLLELTSLIIVNRAGAELKESEKIKKINFFNIEPIPISSSVIRNKVRNGKPISGLVPEEVEKFIYHEGIYKNSCA